MKTLKKLSLVAAIMVATIFSSCSKSDPAVATPAPAAVSTDKTNFKVDGVLIVPDETTAVYYTNIGTGGKYIDVYAKKDGKQVLELHFPPMVGTYPAGQMFNNTSSWLTFIGYSSPTMPQSFDSTSGSITFTVLNVTTDKIRGTFNFVGNDGTTNKTITDGVLVVDAITHN